MAFDPRLLAAAGVIAAFAAVVAAPATTATRGKAPAFSTTRTFKLPAGHATRTFTLQERSGVILLNRIPVRHGVRASVSADIPNVAGIRVHSWTNAVAPSANCVRRGAYDVCTQAGEWCPMPPATWHVRLVKFSGPAGQVHYELKIAAPPRLPKPHV
jgi:hypothetical protein